MQRIALRCARAAAVACAAAALAGPSSGQQQGRRFIILDGQRYGADQLEVAAQSPVPVPQPRCSGSECEIPRARDGHFYVPGSLNGFPLVWLIDTGASHSVVSMEVARNAGIRAGLQADFSTANGRATGAISGGNEVLLGSLRLRDVMVGMSQKLNVNLLGASALARLSVSYDGNTMTIGRGR